MKVVNLVLALLLVVVDCSMDLQARGCSKTPPPPCTISGQCPTQAPHPFTRCPACVNQRCTPNACNQAVGIYFPGDCTKFCKCNVGGAIEFVCPLGLMFDESYGVCVWPEDSSCSESTPYPGC